MAMKFECDDDPPSEGIIPGKLEGYFATLLICYLSIFWDPTNKAILVYVSVYFMQALYLSTYFF